MTVADVDALLYLPGHPRQQVARALRIRALADGFKASFLDQPVTRDGGGNAGLAAVSPPPAWLGFRHLAVTAVTRESDSVVSVHLADPGGRGAARVAGAVLTLSLPASPGAPPLLRSYSLSGAPGTGAYRISVKRQPYGAGS